MSSALQNFIFLKFLAALCLMTFCIPAGGCNQAKKSKASAAPNAVIKESRNNGPLTVTLSLSATSISLADILQLTLEAEAPEESEIIFPEFAASVGDFTLIDTVVSPKILSPKGVSMSRTWFLSPFLPGDYSTPDLKVMAKNKGKLFEVSFPGRTVTVTSFLDKEEKEVDLADIQAPLSPAVPFLYYLSAGCALLLAAALFVFFLRRRKPEKACPPPIPAHLKALEKINALLEENKTVSDFSLFYNQLSLILRRYIEERFGLKAPEQTSEEFLLSLRFASMFSSTQKKLLKHFLQHSDLIKFAKIIPTEAEIMESVELCRGFIATTGEEEMQESGAGGGDKP